MWTYEIVEGEEWADRIIAYDQRVPDVWVCDQPSLTEDNHPGPSREALLAFMERERSTVVVALLDGEIDGYVVADRDPEEGGCRGRWVGFDERDVLKGLLDVLIGEYGKVWGRITNGRIQGAMLSFGCVRDPDDHQIFRYGDGI